MEIKFRAWEVAQDRYEGDNGRKGLIKFSHTYQKILDRHNDVVNTAKLLQVLPVKLEELADAFKNYDTDNGVYKLPRSGEYLMLIFLKNHENYITDLNLFTTLRRSTPEKLQYYTARIGEVFEIVIDTKSTSRRNEDS